MLTAQYIKPTGGRRPIGQFKSLYRVWGRSHKPALQHWQKDLDERGIFNTGTSRKVTDCVWRAAVRAEDATGEEKAFLILLWDLAKAFEKVSHTILCRLECQEQFPLPRPQGHHWCLQVAAHPHARRHRWGRPFPR